MSSKFAQRRPESELRRHALDESGGTSTYARMATLNEGRSLNSGDTDEPHGCRRALTERAALNEGRSLNSGDTRS